MSRKKNDSESVRRGITLRFKVPRRLFDKITEAAAQEDRTLPDWIMEQCRDSLAEREHHRAVRAGA